jgi:integrase
MGIACVSNNPAADLKTAPDVCRERFLTAEETHRLLKAIDGDENQIAAQSIKLLLLTGARRNEITQAKWEYVDWQKKKLLVPCSKSGRPRLIRLNSAALDLMHASAGARERLYISIAGDGPTIGIAALSLDSYQEASGTKRLPPP